MMITNNYTPYKGGVVSSITTSAQVLRNAGHRVIIATLSFTKNDPLEADVIRMPSHIYLRYKQNPCGIPHNAYAVLETLVQQYKPDILHSHHPFLLGMLAAKLSKKYEIPLVFTHHTRYAQYAHYVPLPKPITQSIINRRVQDYCAMADLIIAPSTSLAQELSTNNYIILPSCIRSSFIHNALPTKSLPTIPEIITVSRFVPEKNIPFLLRAYALLPAKKYRFTLFGFGYALEELQRLAYSTYKLDPAYCVFKEHPTEAQLKAAYTHAQLFIFASRTETQGLVVAESLAAGTPVIALDAPGVHDAISNGHNGFLVHTEQELAQKIEQIMSDPLIYNHLSHNAWVSAQCYYPQRHGDALIHTYNVVIQKFLNCQGSS